MSHGLTKEELDEQFELFLKESVSDDSVDLGGSEKLPCAKSSEKSAPKPAASWWQDDEHNGGGTGRGLLGSGKSLRKSLRKSHPIREEDEDPGDTGLREEGLEAVVLSRDNTETQDSVMAPAVNMRSMGLDTLEEEEEKARFFAQLEAGALSTIDYSKLNRELDSTSSTIGTNLRKAEEAEESEEQSHGQSKARVTDITRTSPGSPHYSEDFEDEESGKEPQEEKSKMSPVIAKGHSYVQSGGSEMEALHEAYRQIHVVEDSDDYNHHYSPVEGEERIHRPVSPSFTPQHARQSLQPASTNESDIPTAEELMRPIRLGEDHIRGFSLQPVSAVELDQEKTSCSLERTFPDVKRPGKADPTAGIKGAKGLTSSSSDPPNQDLTWSIREEVERLMEDHNKSSTYISSQAGKVKKQLTSRSSTISHPSTPPLRKPTVAPVRVRRAEGRPAVTSRSSGISRAAATAKSRSPQRPQKSTKNQEKEEDTAEPGLRVSNELVASVQSLVSVLQQQAGNQETRPTHHPPNNSREENSCVAEELRLQLAQKETELQMMRAAAEELTSLRQQNFLLQSKLRRAEESSQRKRLSEDTETAAEDKLQHIHKEMKEQETLIKGYQQENEKLYLQVKAEQAKSKANEEAMFNENHRLLSELDFTREQLSKTSRPVGNICLMDHTQRITDLLAQINMFQRNEEKLSEDIHRLKQEKQALEVDLQLMKKERELAKAQAVSTSGDKTFEMSVLKDQHREEVSALSKKLQWFAENQDLLDRDADRLKAATAEIRQLKEQVEKLKTEVGRRSSEQQKKVKEKSVETTRMQELERQVKELQQILRHRNPNSLPALIYAAASAAEDEDAAKTAPPTVTVLEHRVRRLEAELENHDEGAKHSLRAMEQRFHSVKLRYEQQISELEQQLEQKQRVEGESSAAGIKPWMSQVQTLEAELQQVKEAHQAKEKSLGEQIESLQQQLKNRPPQQAQPSPGRHQRQAEAAFGVRIERLNHELATKTRTIQELSRTVERLQRERRSMLSVPSSRPETCSPETKTKTLSAETRRPPGPTKTHSAESRTKTLSAAARDACGEEVPAAQYEKTYQPTVFSGSHISEVLQENEALRRRLELLQLQTEQEKEALKAEAVQTKEELCRLKQQSAEQLSSIQTEHLRVLDQLCATHALEHSSSKVAEQANRINSQEVQVKHLQQQLEQLQGAKEALVTSRTRESALQRQLSRLLKELKEAKEAQSPEVKLLCSLERKLVTMELRHQHREKELTQVIGGSRQMLEANQQSEVEHWKHLAQDKSRELEAFRLELDSILDILRHLQRQGVVFPPS
ncbi:centrosomal protein of 162 kDa isoform X1 [Seriola aureovittata]|uniref:centrosomal protein of 162 kDa isoform X1 n=1 Tax=Seriola aureovittata TaxID=2871759 RepID=UPI0024BE15B9|nr:centrosomal protein of 162 kDa isoform X1 [Seriola aureovittata]